MGIELYVGDSDRYSFSSTPGAGDAAPEELEAQLGGRPGPACVLLVEHGLEHLQVLDHVLSLRGDIVLMAAGEGALGLALARQHLPQLVVLDAQLPDVTGEEALRLLQSHPDTSAVPVVVIGGAPLQAQAESLFAKGASAFLSKPVDVQLLLAIISELLEPSGAT